MSTVGQRNFSAGEIAPAIYSRVDQNKYQTGLRTLRNAYVMRHGGAASRPGTTFVCEVKNSTQGARIIPFTPNSTQNFLLEMGNLYIRRVLHNNAYYYGTSGGQVLVNLVSAKTISGITNSPQCTVTATSHGYSNGEELYLYSIGGMTELNGRNVIVSDKTTNTFKIKDLGGNYIDTSGYTTYTTGGYARVLYETTTTYYLGEIFDVRFAQAQTVVVFTHPNYEPKSLTYSYTNEESAGTWVFASITFGPGVSAPTNLTNPGVAPGGYDLTYYVTAIDDQTVEESAPISLELLNALLPTGAGYGLSFTPVSGCTYYNVYRKDVQTAGYDGTYGYLTNVAINTTPTLIRDEGQYTIDPSIRPPSQLSVFGSAYNYPSCVGVFQQRFAFGNSITNKERIWLSRIGASASYFSTGLSFQRCFPQTDSDAFLFDMMAREFSGIRHLLQLQLPIVFTQSGECVLQGDDAGALTPTAINPKAISYHGASKVPPIVIGNSALFIQERGQIVRDLAVEFESSGYRGNDLTTFSSHLVDGYTIIDWAYQKTPHSVVWMVRSDGVLLSLTYVKEQQILGWARHDFGDGLAESVACVPEGLEHSVYVVVKRTIDGRTVRLIERMNTRVVGDIKDYVGMDCAVSRDWTNPAITSINVTAVTKANPAVVSYTGTDPKNGDFYTFSSVGGMTELNGNTYMVDTVYAETKTLALYNSSTGAAIDSSAYTTYTSGGTATRSVTTMTVTNPTSLTITAVTKANPGVVTYTGTDPTNGDELVITGVLGMTELNGNTYRVSNVDTAANTFELTDTDDDDDDVSTLGYTTYASGGTATCWSYQQRLTVTASSIKDINLGLDAYQPGASTGIGFTSADVGNAIHFFDSDGALLARIVIDEYVSTTVVKGHAEETFPLALRSTATALWGHAKTVVTGLWHLEGEDVSVLGDGYVVASPNNDEYDIITVEDGEITLPRPYVKVHVGLPFISDVETLNVDTDQGETLTDKKSIANQVTMHLEKTRGVFVGAKPPTDDDTDPLEKLTELKLQNLEGYNETAETFTGEVTTNIQGSYGKGRVFVRQVDPLPMTVNSIMPAGLFPFRKKGGV